MKLQRNQWMILLLFQLFATVNAGVVFQVFTKPVAAYVAGLVFVLVGFYSVYRYLKAKDVFSRLGLAIASIHTLGAVVLFIKRLITPMQAQSVDTVLGIPINIYHKGSTYVFFALMLVTLVMVLRYRKKA